MYLWSQNKILNRSVEAVGRYLAAANWDKLPLPPWVGFFISHCKWETGRSIDKYFNQMGLAMQLSSDKRWLLVINSIYGNNKKQLCYFSYKTGSKVIVQNKTTATLLCMNKKADRWNNVLNLIFKLFFLRHYFLK